MVKIKDFAIQQEVCMATVMVSEWTVKAEMRSQVRDQVLKM
jgi:hypothetical protein